MTQEEIFHFCDEAIMLRHVAPIFFIPHRDIEGLTCFIQNNGTAFLVDTGEIRILATAAHVWTEFQNFKRNHPHAAIGVVFRDGPGRATIVREEDLLDCGEGLIDIVTFRAPYQRPILGPKDFFRVDRWPMSKAKRGDIVSFLGFPAMHREHPDPTIANFGNASFLLEVADASNFQFVISRSRAKTYDQAGLEMPHVRMGGLSGSPVFRRTAASRFSLAGVVSQELNGDEHILFVTHTTFLRRDGTIQK